MYDQTTCADSTNATSSPASVAGPTRFDSLDGLTIDLFGQVPARANLSARQAKELRLLTSGTSGPLLTTSSASENLQSSLESKLRARTLMTGSTLYTLTYKPWITPSGVKRFRLRASVRRTSETAVTGWPTPKATDANGPGNSANRQGGMALHTAAQLAGWNTPTAPSKTNGHQSGNNRYVQHVTSLMKATEQARLTASGELLTGSDALTVSGAPLNPEHSRWLMGYPPEWTLCGVTAMQSMPSKRRSSSK